MIDGNLGQAGFGGLCPAQCPKTRLTQTDHMTAAESARKVAVGCDVKRAHSAFYITTNRLNNRWSQYEVKLLRRLLGYTSGVASSFF